MCCGKRASNTASSIVQCNSHRNTASVEMKPLTKLNNNQPRSLSDCTEQVVVHDLQYSSQDAEYVTKELQRSFSNPTWRTTNLFIEVSPHSPISPISPFYSQASTRQNSKAAQFSDLTQSLCDTNPSSFTKLADNSYSFQFDSGSIQNVFVNYTPIQI